MNKVPTDLFGQRFGRLVVTEKVPPPEHVAYKNTSYWLCLCDCGATTIVRRNCLTSGNTRSCGCLHIDQAKAVKRSNQYTIHGDIAIGTDASGREFIVDAAEVDRLQQFYWSVRANKPHYVRTAINGGEMSLHRYLVGAQADEVVDHANHDPSDNRRSNLRICSTRDNTRNKSLAINNKSGITGVCQEKSGVWRAYIAIGGVNVKLYSGTSKKEAVRRRLLAEAEHYGAFAPQKHLFVEYGIEVTDHSEESSISN